VPDQIKGFINNIVANATWDTVKRIVGGSLVTALGTALWEKLRHGSLDWYAIGGMFCLTLVIMLSFFRKGSVAIVKETPAESKRDATDWNKQYLEENKQRTHFQQEYAIAKNKVSELERKIAELQGQIKPLPEHPIPELRLRILQTCRELQVFLGSHGENVKMEKLPEEDHEVFMSRMQTPERKQARIKYVGDYRRTYRQSVLDLRDEIRQRCGINDEALNAAISFAEEGGGAANALEVVIQRFWEIARDVNA
jgi:hypothetical protein